MLLFRSLQHLHHICGKQICTAWSSCCWIWLIRACGFESTYSTKSRLLMILYKWTHWETLNDQVNCVHLSAPDKALIFSDEVSGLRPVESLPLFTVADLICFLSAENRNRQKGAFMKHISRGSLMQRCEGKPRWRLSDWNQISVPSKNVLQWYHPSNNWIWEVLSLINH